MFAIRSGLSGSNYEPPSFLTALFSTLSSQKSFLIVRFNSDFGDKTQLTVSATAFFLLELLFWISCHAILLDLVLFLGCRAFRTGDYRQRLRVWSVWAQTSADSQPTKLRGVFFWLSALFEGGEGSTSLEGGNSFSCCLIITVIRFWI